MRFTAAISLFLAGLAAAQTATTTAASSSSTECAAKNIVDACLESTQARVAACSPSDWGCMCDNQQAVVTCYNNCPGDARSSPANNQLTQWCAAAKSYGTTSSAVTSVAAATSSASSARASASGSFNSFGNNSTNSANSMMAPASGAIAAMIGLAGLL